jgi:DNA-binding response OmpR family regulator
MLDRDAADYCPTCGQPREKADAPVERFGLKLDHGDLNYGQFWVHLPPAQAEFMRIVIERGQASQQFLLLRISPEADEQIVRVYASRLRRTISKLTDGAVALRTVRCWGYELLAAREVRLAA